MGQKNLIEEIILIKSISPINLLVFGRMHNLNLQNNFILFNEKYLSSSYLSSDGST